MCSNNSVDIHKRVRCFLIVEMKLWASEYTERARVKRDVFPAEKGLITTGRPTEFSQRHHVIRRGRE